MNMKKIKQELAEEAAAAAWQLMNEDERHGCKFGLLPFEMMQAAAQKAIDTTALAVALMKIAETGSATTKAH